MVNSGRSLIDRFSTHNVHVHLVTPYVALFGDVERLSWSLEGLDLIDVSPSQTSCTVLLQKGSFVILSFFLARNRFKNFCLKILPVLNFRAICICHRSVGVPVEAENLKATISSNLC